MKKLKSITLVALASLFMLLQTGCFGSFGLTRKVYQANSKVGDKWVNELVFLVFVVLPVYEIAAFIDVVALNLIEFWTGSNPLAMAPGQSETKQIKFAGKLYNVTATHNRFHIENADQSTNQDLVFNEKTATWTLVTKNNSINVCTYNANGTVTVYKANKTAETYTASTLKRMAESRNMAAR
jgi:hypothetical protein